MVDLAKLSSTDFEPLLNQAFEVSREGEKVIDLQLVEISEGVKQQASERNSFTLTFLGVESTPLPQSIYTLTNSDIGELDIFLVPIGPGKDGLLYEAVFT